MSQARSRRRPPQAWIRGALALVVVAALLTPVIGWITGRSWPSALVLLLTTTGLVTLIRPLLTRLAEQD